VSAVQQPPRLLNTTTSAATAARAASALSEAADQVDPCLPLAAYPGPLADLARMTESLAGCLYHAADLAGAAVALDPAAAAAAGEARTWLRGACGQAVAAGVPVGVARGTVKRDLHKDGGAGAETACAGLLRGCSAQAWAGLARLRTDLEAAARQEPATALPALFEITEVTLHVVMITTFLSQADERLAFGLAGAYEHRPAGRRRTRSRPAGQLRGAAVTLQGAAAGARRAHRALAGARDAALTAAWLAPAEEPRW
jgi:hypothetical protein